MPSWLTAKQAMDYLKISKATFYRMVKDGRIKAYGLAGTEDKRYREDELDALLTPIPAEQVKPDGSLEDEADD